MKTGITVIHGDGWFPPEREGGRDFRWTSGRARLSITSGTPLRSAWARLTCGMHGASATPQVLVVSVDGRDVACPTVSDFLGCISFPIGSGSRFEVELAPQRAITVPGPERTVGVSVARLDVLDGDDLQQCLELEGWYEPEDYEYFPFSWMGLEARLFLPGLAGPDASFLSLPVCAERYGGRQVLAIWRDGRKVAEQALRPWWHIYDLPLRAGEAEGPGDGGGSQVITLRLDALCPSSFHPGDGRSLGVRVGPAEVHGDRRRHSLVKSFHDGRDARAHDVPEAPHAQVVHDTSVSCGIPAVGKGWHLEERDERGPFRWIKLEARLLLKGDVRGHRRFCSVPVFSAYRNLAQHLDVADGSGTLLERLELARGWHAYSLALPPADGKDLFLELRLNKLVPASVHPGDPRELGVRAGMVTLHDDEGRHRREQFLVRNAVENQREMLEGACEVKSFPQTLGIDLYGKCNIKPPCVYCIWDPMKALEGDTTDAVVDDRTLECYGGLFEGARLLVNCSFGEPLLHPALDRVLDLAARTGKVLELSTNGQAFSPRAIRSLAGRQVHLYVSLDAATPGTYARLRNERWRDVLTGLLFLRDARKEAGGWPRLNMVFMPMPANLGDVEQYFRLCRLVEADSLVLRPLLHLEKPGIVQERGGYRFDYERELMSGPDLEPIFAACERYSEKYNVQVVSQFDFGLGEASRFGQSPPAEGA